MKYLLMITMSIACIAISALINKSRKNREYVLNEIKDSAKAFEISEYFHSSHNRSSKYLQNFRVFLSDLSEGRLTVAETHDKILKSMPNIFNKSNDSAFLMKYLHAINDTSNPKIRESISLRCEKLIKQTKEEMQANTYIAIAIAIILVILAI